MEWEKIAIRMVLVIVSAISMNVIYVQFFYEKDLQEYSDAINLIRAIPDSTDILYIGESSNTTSFEQDLDKRPISDFMGDYYPSLSVQHITKPASHAGIYKTLLENIPASNEMKVLVVTLNLRSFGAPWMYSKLETPLQKSMVLLRNNPSLVNRMLLSFKDYENITDTERAEQLQQKWRDDTLHFPYPFSYYNVVGWDYGIQEEIKVEKQDTLGSQLAGHYIKAYAFQIDTNSHPRLNDFNNIIELSKKRNWKLVFNLMAENHEKAGELGGKDLLFLMEENRQKLIAYFESRNVRVVDNLYAVEDKEYIDKNWTTEHYMEGGRKVIAEQVAKSLQGYFPKEYQAPTYSDSIPLDYFNNCDNNLIWGQMNTIVTTENAFSGSKVSSTGNGNPCSLTFLFPPYRLPQESQNTIHISFKVFQSQLGHRSELVIHGEKADSICIWKIIPLNTQITELNTWENYQYTYTLKPEEKNAEILKIFVHNKSNIPVLIDDIRVRFE